MNHVYYTYNNILFILCTYRVIVFFFLSMSLYYYFFECILSLKFDLSLLKPNEKKKNRLKITYYCFSMIYSINHDEKKNTLCIINYQGNRRITL